MRFRARLLMTSLAAWLVLTAPAMAGDDGEGLIGETDDPMITFFSLGVIVFLVLVVTVGTVIQSLLEKRKEKKKEAALRGRTGW